MTEYRDIVGPASSNKGTDVKMYDTLADRPPASVFGVGQCQIGGTVYVSDGVNWHVSSKQVEQYPQRRIKFGSFGDSITDIATVNGTTAQDINAASASNTPIALSNTKFGSWLEVFSGGILHPVFNGGIGGQTTTQIATRVAAAHSAVSTSKALISASVFGADVVIYSGSVNDFTSLTTASSQATIDAAIATALANTKLAINKCKSLGIYFIFHSVMPYGSTVTANEAVVNTATKEYNRQAKAYIDTIPEVAAYYDARTAIEAADGGWQAQYCDSVKTHPIHTACAVIYPGLAELIMSKFDVQPARQGLPKGQNIFSNADLSASSNGLATGITIPTANGTAVTTLPVVNGVNTQQIVFTPSNSTGTDSAISIDIELLAAGASPFVSLSVGDILALEYDLEIDDGSGRAPNIYYLYSYLRKFVGATATIYNINLSPGTAGTNTEPYKSAISEKITGGHIVIDEATGASSGKIGCRITIMSQTQNSNIRIRLSNIRCVKIASTY